MELTFGEHTYTINTDCKGRAGWERYKEYGRLIRRVPDEADTVFDMPYDLVLDFALLGTVAWDREGDCQDRAAWEPIDSQELARVANAVLAGFRETRKN